MRSGIFTIALGAALGCSAPAWADHHEAAESDIGAAAHLSAEATLAAARLVSEGKVYRLGIVTGRDTPTFGDRSYDIEIIDLGTNGTNRVNGHDDKITTFVGIGSQIDGLGHAGNDGVHYGGVQASEFVTPHGLTRFGTQDIPAIATRGVLIDIAAYRGVAVLEPLAEFGADEIEAAAAAQGVSIGRGDVVLFNTGWLSQIDQPGFIGQAPGINVDGARWLAEQGVVAVGADTIGLETDKPHDDGSFVPVHALLLADYGVYILETIDTRELAADEAWEFLFVLGAPRFEGAVQAVINPVAIR